MVALLSALRHKILMRATASGRVCSNREQIRALMKMPCGVRVPPRAGNEGSRLWILGEIRRAHLVRGVNRLDSEYQKNGDGVVHGGSGLTTQAQRPGAREATIATATPPPGSLQRMVRRRGHVQLFPEYHEGRSASEPKNCQSSNVSMNSCRSYRA